MMRFLAPVLGTATRLALAGVAGSLALSLAGCLFQTAGGSSDTDNTVAVTGGIQEPGGGPAAACTVRLRREDYLSPFPAFGKRAAGAHGALLDRRDGITDSLGRFRLDSLDTGEYVLEASGGDSLGVLQRFHLGREPRLVNLMPRPLAPMARVDGVVLFRAGTYRVFVQVYGLERMVPVDMVSGRYSLSLPPGDYTLRIVDPERARAFAKLRTVSLSARQSLRLDSVVLGDSSEPFAAWRHSSEIVINTSPEGAALTDDVHGFPLLVRLDTSNFDFSRALPRGQDIRFSKSDGKTPLPYEIETWDPARRSAALWVRMDTVLANHRTQSVYLYWGKADAADASDGAAVFPPADGHAAVWHLADSGGNATGGYRDATGNGNAGTGNALGDTSAVAGLVGGAARLAGKPQGIKVADSPTLRLGAGGFTLSAWVRATGPLRKQQVLAKRAEPAGDYEFQTLGNGKVAAYPGPPGSGAIGFESKGAIAANQWHHLAFVRDGKRIALYIDGKEDIASTTNVTNVDCDSALWIGRDGTDQTEEWVGLLDEVRVTARPLGPDWIKLCHRNQAPGSNVLQWRRFP